MTSNQELTGISVISIGTGEKLGVVEQMAFDSTGRHVAALIIHSGNGAKLFSSESSTASWLPVAEIKAIGPDAITVQDPSALRETASEENLLSTSDILKRKIVTEGGAYLGDVSSIHFNNQSLDVTHFEISHGILKSATSVPIEYLVNIGQDIIMVTDAAAGPRAGSADEDAAPEPEETEAQDDAIRAE